MATEVLKHNAKLRRIFDPDLDVRRLLDDAMKFYWAGWLVGLLAAIGGVWAVLTAGAVRSEIVGAVVAVIGVLIICTTITACTACVWALRVIWELRGDRTT